MSTRVVHFSVDDTGVLATLRNDSYQIHEAKTYLEELTFVIRERQPDTLVVSDDQQVVSVDDLSSACAVPSMARILFRLNGFDVARQIRRTVPNVEIIFITANNDPDFVAAGLGLGAEGYILKDDVARNLRRAIDAVLQGGRYFSS